MLFGQNLYDNYQADLDSANARNDSRYEELLGLYRSLGQRASGVHDQIGQASTLIGTNARERISENAGQQFASAQQQLLSRGLGNSTLINAAQRGVAADAEDSNQQVDESQAQLQIQNLRARLGSDFDASQLLGGVIERREDVVPDFGQYASLLQAAGQAGVGAPKRKITIGPTGPRGGSFRASGPLRLSGSSGSSGPSGPIRFGR